MNADPLLQYLQWCVYSALGVLSFYGFGAGAARSVPSLRSLPARYFAPVGFCVVLVLGGLLSLVHLVSFLLLFALWVAGGAVAAWDLQQRQKTVPVAMATYGLWIGMAGLLLLEGYFLSGTAYNHHDDFHGYLVYPMRLLQTGTFPLDPYNFRFGTGVLGAHSFFMAMGLVLGDLDFLKVLEFLVGGALMLSLLPPRASRSSMWALGGAWLCVFLALPWSANLSSVWTSVALFLCLIQLLFSHEQATLKVPAAIFVLAGVIAGVLLALKTSNLPGIALLLVFGVVKARRVAVCAWLMAGLAAAVASWLAVHHQASLTLLYPFLGPGTICEAYPAQFESMSGLLRLSAEIAQVLWQHPVFLLFMGASVLMALQRKENRLLGILLSLSALGMTWVMLLKMGVPLDGRSGHLRHALPWVVALLLWMMSRLEISRSRPLLERTIGVGLLLGVCWMGTTKFHTLKAMQDNSTNRARNPYFQTDTGRERALHMQQAIPQGAPFLVRSARPYHFNFERNPIWIADFPGLAGGDTCPQWPMDAPSFAAHFKAQGIRYIAYSYLNEGGFPKEFFGVNLKHPQAFFRLNAQRSFAFQDQLNAMMPHFTHLYNDGVYVVMDLKQPALAPH